MAEGACAAAADRKNQNRRDSMQSSKSDERLTSPKGNCTPQSEVASDSNEIAKQCSEGQTAEKIKSDKGRRPSLDNSFKKGTQVFNLRKNIFST